MQSGTRRARRPGALLAAMAMSHSAIGCVPVDPIEIPAEVEWIAWLGPSQEDLEDGRLMAVEDFDRIASPQSAGWLMGYSTEQLESVNHPPSGFVSARLLIAQDGDTLLPDALLSRPFFGVQDPPAVTTDWLRTAAARYSGGGPDRAPRPQATGAQPAKRAKKGGLARPDRAPRPQAAGAQPAKRAKMGGLAWPDRAPRPQAAGAQPAKRAKMGGLAWPDRAPRPQAAGAQPAKRAKMGGLAWPDRAPRPQAAGAQPAKRAKMGGLAWPDRAPRNLYEIPVRVR